MSFAYYLCDIELLRSKWHIRKLFWILFKNHSSWQKLGIQYDQPPISWDDRAWAFMKKIINSPDRAFKNQSNTTFFGVYLNTETFNNKQYTISYNECKT